MFATLVIDGVMLQIYESAADDRFRVHHQNCGWHLRDAMLTADLEPWLATPTAGAPISVRKSTVCFWEPGIGRRPHYNRWITTGTKMEIQGNTGLVTPKRCELA
jgi:hypothetical protein